jgi:hypothetical protein
MLILMQLRCHIVPIDLMRNQLEHKVMIQIKNKDPWL